MSPESREVLFEVNQQVAAKLRECADLLHQQGDNPFRSSAYRKAADTVEGLERSLEGIIREGGRELLTTLPNIGPGIAAAIREMVQTGRWTRLERLRGTLDPVRLFQTIPGIGEVLAERIHETLEIDSLEELELSAHDGRLERVPGMGKRRVSAVRAVLKSVLGRVRRAPLEARNGPPVETLLEVDREYRQRAAAGSLRKIAPRRFNPEHEAWLPILHIERAGWHFTVLYSNTANAHRLGRTRDWVVVYFYDHEHREGQHTIVTETRGPLAGRRVVRGREMECQAHYRERS